MEKRGAVLYAVYLACATFLLTEAALRLVRPFHRDLNSLLYLPAAHAGYERVGSLEELMETTVLGFVPRRARRGFILSSRSFRTREYAGREPGDALRVVTLGDSFNFSSGGTAYRRMWSNVLERELAAALSRPVEVYALGVPGVGPRFALRLWELERELLRPDLVVLAFFVGNDFTDEHRLGRRRRVADSLARFSLTFRLGRNLRRLRAEAARRRARSRDDDRVHPAGGLETAAASTSSPAVFSPEEFLRIQQTRTWIYVRRNRDAFERLAADAGDVLKRLRDAVEVTGGELLVMVIPDELQVDPGLRARVLASLDLRAVDVDVDLPQRRLRQLLDAAGIAYLDLLPDFREASAAGRLYWPRNTHWNEAGNELAGRLLARRLLAGLPPPAEPGSTPGP